MRQIDLTNYTVEVQVQLEGQKIPNVEKFAYDVRGSLIEMLFSPDLGLRARGLLDQEDLARKIRDCPNHTLLLEEEDYKKVLKAIETVSGLGQNDLELIHRVVDAKQVEVEAKKTTE